MGSAVQPRLSKRKTMKRDKHNLTVTNGCKAFEEASYPVNLSICVVGVPPTAPAQSALYNRYSKTEPEALMHLNLYSSRLADNRTSCTQWQKGL